MGIQFVVLYSRDCPSLVHTVQLGCPMSALDWSLLGSSVLKLSSYGTLCKISITLQKRREEG